MEKICLFCDNCENSGDFEKVKVIEKYDAETKTFKELTTKPDIYVRCMRCGSVEILEYEEGDEEIEG